MGRWGSAVKKVVLQFFEAPLLVGYSRLHNEPLSVGMHPFDTLGEADAAPARGPAEALRCSCMGINLNLVSEAKTPK